MSYENYANRVAHIASLEHRIVALVKERDAQKEIIAAKQETVDELLAENAALRTENDKLRGSLDDTQATAKLRGAIGDALNDALFELRPDVDPQP